MTDLAWRTAYKAAFPLAQLWWCLRRQSHRGALVVVTVGDRILLLRSSYRKAWNLPGGGIQDGECPEEAARRELSEEIGLQASILTSTGHLSGHWEGRRDQVHFFELHLQSIPSLVLDNREITEARFVTRRELDDMLLTGPVQAYFQGPHAKPAR